MVVRVRHTHICLSLVQMWEFFTVSNMPQTCAFCRFCKFVRTFGRQKHNFYFSVNYSWMRSYFVVSNLYFWVGCQICCRYDFHFSSIFYEFGTILKDCRVLLDLHFKNSHVEFVIHILTRVTTYISSNKW